MAEFERIRKESYAALTAANGNHEASFQPVSYKSLIGRLQRLPTRKCPAKPTRPSLPGNYNARGPVAYGDLWNTSASAPVPTKYLYVLQSPRTVKESSSLTISLKWCYDCTAWQLSVEPGVAVCAPPNSAAEVDELALLYAKPAEVIVSREEREERVEQWIQDNPSEAGDYDGIEIATQASVIDTASEVSGPSLLDDNINDLGNLPQALNAINLSRIGRYDEPPTTTVSNVLVRSGNENAAAESTDFETRSQDSNSKATIIANSALESNQQTDYATTNSRTSVNDVSNHDLALVELGTTAVVNGPPERQRSPGPSGWARPNQRKIPWAPPRYVLSGSGVDFYHYYYLQQGDGDEPE
ncbi:hypothetical protein CMQ_4690 [Grosmannia clavigera kw1407]|uniref:Uncharacterized protein n=1 Tax=Grosmannia clavigera (strain kw1407 / UAMH 11150) TaxID=655863 RepID=F0XTU2_GROCL|nr:uncharacterized protein CMQ_4690 [Grosmannia clavigera kw1407]EFW98838.1 hypothetical protein CMQ_4690 [Grosmannia clavigera kw1407]